MKLIYGSLLAVFTAILFYRVFYLTDRNITNLNDYLISTEVPDTFCSSIWCENCNENNAKCCEMHNIIFYPKFKTFAFILSENSIINGIQNAEEFNKISTSSVVNHTELFLPIVIMSNNDAKLKEVRYSVNKPVFLLHRFKPDNIMHVLHDDLLPLFARYESECRGDVNLCIDWNLLAFIDPIASTGRTGDFEEWYKILSKHPLVNLYEENDAIVLPKVLTGLPGTTIGFQYGFNKPQGPVPVREHAVRIFKKFVNFVKGKFAVRSTEDKTSKEALLISRKQSRKILNENEVIQHIENAYKTSQCSAVELKISTLDLQVTTDISEILTLISNSDLIVAMHGASSYLVALFSKENSTIIELFPYGIQPQFVSPILSMSQLASSWFTYAPWENLDFESSIEPDSDAAVLLGGLSHLSDEERQVVKHTLPVPAVPCCHHPAYLHRMFQDTIVGKDFEVTVKNALLTAQRKTNHVWTEGFYVPGPVGLPNCTFIEDSSITKIIWKTPINVSTFNNTGTTFTYDIIATTISGSQLEKTETNLELNINEILLNVWIRACVNNVCGQDIFMNCK